MNCVEAEGNSIDEAIQNALKALGVERARVEIEILSSATRGLFGIGGKKARVRATLRQPLEAIAAEGTRREPVPAPEVGSGPGGPGRGHSPEAAAALAEKAQARLRELLGRMGFTAEVSAAEEAGQVVLAIQGDSSGILIGRRGQTLDALEYWVNRLLSREARAPVRVVVDCENYREKRRQALEDLARRVGQRVKQRGKPVALNYLSPRERRVVHLALQGDPQLATRSSGKGYYRKLIVYPRGEVPRGGTSPAAE